MSYRELLLGAGNDRRKKVSGDVIPAEWADLTTLDVDPDCKPDVVHDLNVLPYPFPDNSFDEVHAYQVMEHLGSQGDVKFFFDQFNELYRILKPGGLFVASVPMWDSPWAWSDPGHRRVITRHSLAFLRKDEYQQLGKTSMADYRSYLRCDFETVGVREEEHEMAFVLKALK